MKRFFKNKKGFTLIELIVVIAILGILAGIAVPKYSDMQNSSKVKADAATAMSMINAAKVQEAETNTIPTTGAVSIDAKYMKSVTPTSGGTFALTYDSSTALYTVTWTPTNAANYNFKQTLVEGTAFAISNK